jgi:hypothetical protein
MFGSKVFIHYDNLRSKASSRLSSTSTLLYMLWFLDIGGNRNLAGIIKP